MMANQRQKTSSLASRPPSFGSADNDDSSLSSDDKKECLLRKLSASFLARRPSSSRFSMIALSENLADLLQREGISQQVKAAKAVGLILCCFLFCWFPFLLVCSQTQKSNPIHLSLHTFPGLANSSIFAQFRFRSNFPTLSLAQLCLFHFQSTPLCPFQSKSSCRFW
jgi:hypothetical protein